MNKNYRRICTTLQVPHGGKEPNNHPWGLFQIQITEAKHAEFYGCPPPKKNSGSLRDTHVPRKTWDFMVIPLVLDSDVIYAYLNCSRDIGVSTCLNLNTDAHKRASM